ncbi:hypothetical protein BDV32DRAFT_132356 [Aspergillus pseudonomiae]|nr:hypothetical protein BDV32DRAFT_132356 [Aspergillus pseudonomiae]
MCSTVVIWNLLATSKFTSAYLIRSIRRRIWFKFQTRRDRDRLLVVPSLVSVSQSVIAGLTQRKISSIRSINLLRSTPYRRQNVQEDTASFIPGKQTHGDVKCGFGICLLNIDWGK